MDTRTRVNLLIGGAFIFGLTVSTVRYVAPGINRDRHNEDIATCARFLVLKEE